MSETIHWAGTPAGICERKDSGADKTSETLHGGTRIINSAEAYHKGNVNCPICREHIDSMRTPDLAWMEEHYWALICAGEGAQAIVVPGKLLEEELHGFMCCCGFTAAACELESFIEIIEDMKDSDEWLRDEGGKLFQFSFEMEISSLTITRVDRISSCGGPQL